MGQKNRDQNSLSRKLSQESTAKAISLSNENPDPSRIVTGEERRNLYNKLVRTARLSKLLLRNASFDVKPEILAISDKSSLKREILGTADIVSEGKDNGVCVFSVKWTASAKQSRKTLVKGTASYIVAYRLESECPLDIVEEFGGVVAKAATYSYFRTLYSQFDWSAEIGSPPLPVLQFKPRV